MHAQDAINRYNRPLKKLIKDSYNQIFLNFETLRELWTCQCARKENEMWLVNYILECNLVISTKLKM